MPRSHASKGSGHASRNKKRLEQHLATLGRPYVDKDQVRLARAAAATGVRGTAAISVHAAAVAAVPEATAAERTEFLQSLREQGLPTSFIAVNERGENYCSLCKKHASEEHVRSGAHIMAVERESLETALAGSAQGFRRRSSQSGGFEGGATKSALMRYWGDALENVVSYYMQRLRDESTMTLQGRRCSFGLDISQITSVRLAFVSYKQMSGKYCPDTRLVYWDELDDDEAITKELGKDPLVPQPGQGWWPVVTSRPVDSVRSKMPWQLQNATMVCCFYQLMETPLASWPWSEPESEP